MRILKDLSRYDEYVPGKGVDEVAREHGLPPEDMVKLASNENPLGPPTQSVEAIRENAEEASVYPTALYQELKECLAHELGVPIENVVVGAGADGVFDTVGRAVIEEGDSVLTPDPGFSYYGMSARYLGAEENSFDINKEEDFEIKPDRVIQTYDNEKIVYVTTPNNPTGTTLTVEEIEKIAENTDGFLFVDEAYWHFSETESAISLALERDDVGVARTFSKAHGLAGLRVGYGVLPDKLAEGYRKVTTPFSVGTLTIHAAIGALSDKNHLKKSVELAEWGRKYMQNNIDLQVYDSEANFVLVNLEETDHTASEAAEELEKRGVIVRDTTSFGLPECIRVSVGTKEGTKKAVEEINKVCG